MKKKNQGMHTPGEYNSMTTSTFKAALINIFIFNTFNQITMWSLNGVSIVKKNLWRIICSCTELLSLFDLSIFTVWLSLPIFINTTQQHHFQHQAAAVLKQTNSDVYYLSRSKWQRVNVSNQLMGKVEHLAAKVPDIFLRNWWRLKQS